MKNLRIRAKRVQEKGLSLLDRLQIKKELRASQARNRRIAEAVAEAWFRFPVWGNQFQESNRLSYVERKIGLDRYHANFLTFHVMDTPTGWTKIPGAASCLPRFACEKTLVTCPYCKQGINH